MDTGNGTVEREEGTASATLYFWKKSKLKKEVQ
jgi:hypothetical protein